MHADVAARRRVFHRVVKQVQKEPLKPTRVTGYRHRLRDDALNVQVLGLSDGLELLGDRGGEGAQIDRAMCKSDLAGLGARQRQQLIDEAGELVDFLDL